LNTLTNKKISVCIICKDEETNIERCLKSIKWADEIIIVDSGSRDATLEIAKKYTDKIFIRSDWPGFGKQKQRAEKLASHDWILAIDSDEEVTPELHQEILDVLSNADENTVFMVNRLTNLCGQFIYHSGWHPDYINRLYNRKNFGYNDQLVHESISCQGAHSVKLKHKLFHYQYDDLHRYISKRNSYAEIGACEKFLKNKKTSLSQAVLSALFSFIRHYFLRAGFLDGKLGFVISVIQMQYTFNKYLFLKYKKK
jgi:(heptosyl)LPS beta-1,4-glucosyltransferase